MVDYLIILETIIIEYAFNINCNIRIRLFKYSIKSQLSRDSRWGR